jgi:hypothetical protein
VAGKSRARKAKTSRRTRRIKKPVGAERPKKTDALAYLTASGAQALALPIDPAWQAGVKLNLKLLFIHAALVDEFSLPDDIEPAPVFRA